MNPRIMDEMDSPRFHQYLRDIRDATDIIGNVVENRGFRIIPEALFEKSVKKLLLKVAQVYSVIELED